MIVSLLWIALGLVVLVAGAEALVRGASGLARAVGLSPLVIGLTVVAFGTSSPELAVSVQSVLDGAGDLAIGNIAGSNIFNVAVILGISAMVCPLAVHRQVVRFDMPTMLVASVVFSVFCFTGAGLSRWEGALLFAGIVVYTAVLVRKGKGMAESGAAAVEPPGGGEAAVAERRAGRVGIQVALALAGFAGLVLGARLLVEHATAIARSLEVPDAVIGLTIVAAGTSLPELAASLVAALKRETDLAIGNIVGSNLFNVLAIGGAASLVRPVPPGQVALLDFGVMLGASALLLPLMKTGFRLVRWEGAVLLSVYLGYLFLRWP